MAKNPAGSPDSVEAITSQYPEPREAQGLDSIKGFKNTSGENSDSTILMPRKNTQAADPAFMPIANRVYQPIERGGAAYSIRAPKSAPVNPYSPITVPEAKYTQANGRILASAIKRTAPNFAVGMQG